MKTVLGIDIGLRGIAYAWVRDNKLISAEVHDLIGPHRKVRSLSTKDSLLAVRQWFYGTLKPLIQTINPTTIVIEKQLKGNYLTLMGAIFILCCESHKNVIIVTPHAYKKHFGLCMKNYNENKKAAREYLRKNESDWINDHYNKTTMTEKHLGDIADAYLMACYICQRLSKN